MGADGGQQSTAARDTATNPAMLDAFALAIAGAPGPPAYPSITGHEPDAAAAGADAAAVGSAMDMLRALVPDAGSYLSESDFFDARWRKSFWGPDKRTPARRQACLRCGRALLRAPRCGQRRLEPRRLHASDGRAVEARTAEGSAGSCRESLHGAINHDLGFAHRCVRLDSLIVDFSSASGRPPVVRSRTSTSAPPCRHVGDPRQARSDRTRLGGPAQSGRPVRGFWNTVSIGACSPSAYSP